MSIIKSQYFRFTDICNGKYLNGRYTNSIQSELCESKVNAHIEEIFNNSIHKSMKVFYGFGYIIVILSKPRVREVKVVIGINALSFQYLYIIPLAVFTTPTLVC